MTLLESVELIDMYNPENNNTEQLHTLVQTVEARRRLLLQQKKDIDDMLAGLDEVQDLCDSALARTDEDTHKRHQK
jgi:hypothetical protein